MRPAAVSGEIRRRMQAGIHRPRHPRGRSSTTTRRWAGSLGSVAIRIGPADLDQRVGPLLVGVRDVRHVEHSYALRARSRRTQTERFETKVAEPHVAIVSRSRSAAVGLRSKSSCHSGRGRSAHRAMRARAATRRRCRTSRVRGAPDELGERVVGTRRVPRPGFAWT